ncbi:MAG: FmdB family zinc ribbon protein [Candidatus Omnitrophota bacterium]|nr:zinc ribbon domain-containing protein [Candidatus Omnitrophota bacterium]
MPHYDYECTKCKHAFEAFQNIKDKPLFRCPKCKSKLRRLISGGVGIIFKGSGFYATDYKKKPKEEKPPNNNPPCAKLKDACSSCPAKEN